MSKRIRCYIRLEAYYIGLRYDYIEECNQLTEDWCSYAKKPGWQAVQTRSSRSQTVQRFEHLPIAHECSLHGSGGQHGRLLAGRGGVVVFRRDGRVNIVQRR